MIRAVNFLRCACFLAFLAFGFISARADIIVVTGGDLGEGYAPLPVTFAAIDVGSTTSYTVQGVTFVASDPHLSLTSTDTIGNQPSYITLSPTPTTDDVNMANLIANMKYGEGADLTLTITGLTVGTTYQLDTISGWQVNYSSNVMTSSAAGATTVVDSMSGGQKLGDGKVYDFRQTLQPDGTGKIVITYSSTNGFNDSSLDAFSITTTPEPSAGLLLGLGLLTVGGFCRWRKQVR